MRTSLQRGGFGLTGIILVLAALAALSARTGGPVSWHVTKGISMLPGITKGTLVVVAREPSYEVGDVVAYQSKELGGAVVLHRVLRVEGDRLVMKGDNNSWIDPETPAAADALGSRVFQLKGVGPAVDWLRRPIALVVGALVLGLALLQGTPSARRRRRGRSHGAGAVVDERAGPPDERASARPPRRLPTVPAGADTALRVGIGCCALLVVAATTGPFLETTSAASTAQAVVTWEYGADAPAGLAYPDGSATTGDQLYPRLVSEADVTAALTVDVPEGTTVSGSWRLDVSAENGDGWTRTTSTGAPADVSSAPTRLTATVPLRELLEMATRLTQETGVEAGGLRLLVTAVLDLELAADGQVVTQQATSVLAFDADAQRIALSQGVALVQPAPLPLPSAAATTSTLRLVGVALPPGPTRLVALAGVALGLLALGLGRASSRSEDEDELIARQAGDLLVPAHPSDDPEHVVDVATFAALKAIAERYERMVLFADHDGVRFYFVLDDSVAYRYYSETRAAELDAQRAAAATPPVALPALPRQREPLADRVDR